MACAVLISALALAGLDAEHAARALVAAHVLSRTAMIVVAAALPNARAEGAGLGGSLAVAPVTALATAVLGVAGALAVSGLADGALTVGVSLVVLAGALAVQARTFGGRTGDTLGATGKLVEVAVLVALSGAWAA
jgi:adenosylcobinamide-GDP ribazoletransferase